jgi:hypothetical protein
MKMTAVVALAGASFASPIIAKSDAFAQVGHRLSGGDAKHQVARETIAAGGFSYEMPATWGRLGAGSVAGDEGDAAEAAGTIVSAVCPGGSAGATCKDGVQVTFVSYRGGKGHELPLVSSIEDSFDAQFATQLPGFKKVSSAPQAAADGTRWLRYEFNYGSKAGMRSEVLGAFRHGDGSGVIAVAVGPQAAMAQHSKAIGAFLAGAVESDPAPE